MASGYAKSRPPVHPRVLELVQRRTGRCRRGLDVGCGAGVSTRALSVLADECIGIEPAEPMLRWTADVAPGARFAVAAAEALPFPDGCVDVITAAGSLNYADLARFFPEAARVLTHDGVLVVYDFSPGRPVGDTWFDRFMLRYPPPVFEGRELSPEILASLDSGFSLDEHERFEIALPLDFDFYVDYMLTETNVAAAVRQRAPLGEIRSWIVETLRPEWTGSDVIFHGYYACMRPTASRTGSRRTQPSRP
jgi:SAM-dependent methyltransferase